MKIEITPLILTFNERENIAQTIAQLSWAKEILIVDSGSTDGTLELARAAHPNVRIVTRAFDSFASQCNFGLTHINTEWVLSMDADYVLTRELIAEIAALDPAPVRIPWAGAGKQDNPIYQPTPKPWTERWPWLVYMVLGVASVVLLGILIVLGRQAMARHDAGVSTAESRS